MTLTDRWERATDWPLMIAAVAFLVAYAVPILQLDLSHDLHEACDIVAWGTWALFVLDYFARLFLSDNRKRFFVRHLPDLAIIALPLLRPLRLLRLATLLKVLNRKAAIGLQGKVAIYIGGGSALLAFCGALAVLDEERGKPGANIEHFGDAMWWAITTMTTVGYGDRYPVTAVGRLAAVALMIGGIALLGMVTATLASWLVKQVNADDQQQNAELEAALTLLTAKVDQLLAERDAHVGRLVQDADTPGSYAPDTYSTGAPAPGRQVTGSADPTPQPSG